jgi:hypothetical protein
MLRDSMNMCLVITVRLKDVIIFMIDKTALRKPWLSLENCAKLHPVFPSLDFMTIFYLCGVHPVALFTYAI